jgi:hypothetical protein
MGRKERCMKVFMRNLGYLVSLLVLIQLAGYPQEPGEQPIKFSTDSKIVMQEIRGKEEPLYIVKISGSNDKLPTKTVLSSYIHRDERIIVSEPPELKPPLNPYVKSYYGARQPVEKSQRNMWIINGKFNARHRILKKRALPGFYHVKVLIHDFNQYPKVKPKIPRRDDAYESKAVIRLGYLGEIGELIKGEPDKIAPFFEKGEAILKDMRETLEKKPKEEKKAPEKREERRKEGMRGPGQEPPKELQDLLKRLRDRDKRPSEQELQDLLKRFGQRPQEAKPTSKYTKEELQRFAKNISELIGKIYRHELSQPEAVLMPITLNTLREGFSKLQQTIMAQLQPMVGGMMGMAKIDKPEDQLPKTESEFKMALTYFNHEYFLVLKYDALLLAREMLDTYATYFERYLAPSEDFEEWLTQYNKGVSEMRKAHEEMLTCPRGKEYIELCGKGQKIPNPREKDLNFVLETLSEIGDIFSGVWTKLRAGENFKEILEKEPKLRGLVEGIKGIVQKTPITVPQ